VILLFGYLVIFVFVGCVSDLIQILFIFCFSYSIGSEIFPLFDYQNMTKISPTTKCVDCASFSQKVYQLHFLIHILEWKSKNTWDSQDIPFHNPLKILQDQNDPFFWPNLLLFYSTNMKKNERTGNWSHITISQEWISSSFYQHLCNLNLIVFWC